MKPRLSSGAIPTRGFVVDLTALRAHELAEATTRLTAAREAIADTPADKVTPRAQRALTALQRAVDSMERRPSRGEHHFRLPSPIRLEAIRAFTRSRDSDSNDRALLEFGAACIGAGWAHRTMELETPWPADPTIAALTEYAEAVTLEILDAGYSEAELRELADQVFRAVVNRDRDHAEAEKIEGFFGRILQPPGSPS